MKESVRNSFLSVEDELKANCRVRVLGAQLISEVTELGWLGVKLVIICLRGLS